jgi:hypothetical protein
MKSIKVIRNDDSSISETMRSPGTEYRLKRQKVKVLIKNRDKNTNRS